MGETVKEEIEKIIRYIDNKEVEDLKNKIKTNSKSEGLKYIASIPEGNIRINTHELIGTFIREATKGPTVYDKYRIKTMEKLLNEKGLLRQKIKEPDLSILNDPVYIFALKIFEEGRYDLAFSEEMQEINDAPIYYNANMKENIKKCFNQYVGVLLAKKNNEFRARFKNGSLSEKEQAEFEKEIRENLSKEYRVSKNKEVKESAAIQLSNIIMALEALGTLQENNDLNNKRLESQSLKFLEFDFQRDKDKKQKGKSDFCLEDLTEKNFVKNFSDIEITLLNAFYSNRLAKAIEDFNDQIYFLEKLGIFEKLSKGEEPEFDFSDSEIKELMAKKIFLERIAIKIIKEKREKKEEFTDTRIGHLIKNEKSSNVLDRSLNFYEKEYNQYGEPGLKRDMKEDLELVMLMAMDKTNLYAMKDQAIESALIILSEEGKKRKINWGYVQDIINGENSIERKNRNIIIGIDLKGFNMPIKLHCERVLIERFFSLYNGTKDVPVYEGENDMKIGNEIMTTQIVSKLTKYQREMLKGKLENLSKIDSRYKYLTHINWMMLPNRVPKHIAGEDGKKPERYVNIKTGKIKKIGQNNTGTHPIGGDER